MMNKTLRFSVITVAVLGMASFVWACSVPVFRYALERWVNDQYEVIVFHKGKLTDQQQKIVNDLTEEGAAGEQHANVRLTLIDLAGNNPEKPVEPEAVELWEAQKTETLPWMVVKYPAIARKPVDVWAGELTKANIERLLDSPARRAISRKLLKGETAVWVLLESGNKEADDAAFKILQAELLRAQKELKLPKIDEADIEQGLVSTDETGLKLQFSTLRLSRENEQEKLFVEMLLGSEDDLRDFDEPMAFPVFGRGRVMYALIGRGINADTIRQACQDLIGPCTCEVKEENPGIDIITSVDWDELVQPFVEIDRELPPLPGFGGITDVDQLSNMNDENKENKKDVENKQTDNASEGSTVLVTGKQIASNEHQTTPVASSEMNPVIRNVIIAAGVGFGVVLILSFAFLSNKNS